MLSKKMLIIVGLLALVVVNIIILSITSRTGNTPFECKRIVIFIVAPLQDFVTGSTRFVRDVWRCYFYLASAAKENVYLKKSLAHALEKNNRLKEMELSNSRLLNLLNFQKNQYDKVLAAEVISIDPSPWFKTVIINKGKVDGLEKEMPVVVSEGIVGQITAVSAQYSRVLMIVDQNCAVDALVQRTRARGIIKGELSGTCFFDYVLHRHDVLEGDTVVSSGLDGVFPKGLRIGYVSEVIRGDAGVFQEVTVIPFVDFEKLEEVLVVLNFRKNKF